MLEAHFGECRVSMSLAAMRANELKRVNLLLEVEITEVEIEFSTANLHRSELLFKGFHCVKPAPSS